LKSPAPPRETSFIPVEPDSSPADPVTLFRQRASALGVTVVDALAPRPGDRDVHGAAAIASTGSVLLTGPAAARRPLLAANRVVVRIRKESIVLHPSDLAAWLGAGEALILTGASRTADIEKQIVRGIHGSESLFVVLT
jgi:hypothetical protein